MIPQKATGICLLVLAFSLVAASQSAAGGRGFRVTGDFVDLRALPDDQSEIAGLAPRGTVLRSAGDPSPGAKWVEVIPPSNVVLWVHHSHVSNGVVTGDALQIRSGPGVGYRPVGTLDRGARVNIQQRLGNWYAIDPPPSARLWISADHIEPVQNPGTAGGTAGEMPRKVVSPPQAERVPGTQLEAVATDSAPARTNAAASSRIPAELGNREMQPGIPQGTRVAITGVIQPAPFAWRRPSRYCLRTDLPGGMAYSVRYLVADADSLFRMMGRMVRVEGGEYWLAGVRTPVIVALAIRELPEDPGR
jgi:uncharacterized protein YgiM (DUF1202 family)